MKKTKKRFFLGGLWRTQGDDNPIHDPHYTHNAILKKNSMKTNTLDLGWKELHNVNMQFVVLKRQKMVSYKITIWEIVVIIGVRDCLKQTQQIFSYIVARTC